MILKYMKNDDENYSVSAEGDTTTGWLTVTVIEEGVAANHDLDPSEARELAAEIVSIANRLKPSPAAELDAVMKIFGRSPIPPCGTTGF